MPSEFKVRISPNPFNSGVRLQVSGVREQEIRIKIFDLNGKLVGAGFMSAQITEGAHKARPYIWQPDESISSGIYLVRVSIEGQTITKRVMYLK